MKTLFIFLALLLACCLPAMALENPELVKLVKKHALKPDGSPAYPEWYKGSKEYADNKMFIHNDPESVADREFQDSVRKLDSKEEARLYVGH